MEQYEINFESPFSLESGKVLSSLKLQYASNKRSPGPQDEVIWVCHALTANADCEEWWPGMVGPGKLFDTEKYFVICANMPGSPYGSTSPLSIDPKTGQPYFLSFPEVSNRDIVKAFTWLREALGIKKIHTLTGGSMGGQQVLEWAISEPDVIQRIIPLCTNACHSPWGVAFNQTQRMALKADQTFFEDRKDAGKDGLKAARAIALLSYRNYQTYKETQSQEKHPDKEEFPANTYQKYQGQKLVERFNAHCYWYLSRAMDSHDIGRGRGGTKAALSKIRAESLIISIDSDILFPPEEQEFLYENLHSARMALIDSLYGHDGFLLEDEKLKKQITTQLFKY